MAELSPEARALLAAAAGADDPTQEQRSRADAAARIALALHGATDLPPLDPPRAHLAPRPNGAPPTLTTSATKLGTAASGWKLALAAAALIAAGWLGTRALPAGPEPVRRPANRIELPPPQLTQRAIATAVTAVPADRPATSARADAISEPMRAEPPARAGDVRASDARAGGSARTRGLVQAAPTLQAEVALIASANGLIREQRLAEAERVLATHARRFPHGALREERAALTVLVLCEAGSQPRAQRAMQRFLRTAPQSVVAQRVRAACAAQPGHAL